MMNYNEVVTSKEFDSLKEYYSDHYDEWIILMEELDSWNGYLDGERREPMECIDDYLDGLSIREILSRLGRYFDIDDDYFYFDSNGNIESTNEIDYDIDLWSMDSVIMAWDKLYIVDEFPEKLRQMWQDLENLIYG